ncbi:AEC family transporter [Massilia sp. TW-1]|uniref:AEC family transporter n=1 Tax=Telluria antibiotica TaxID=2717319 RepID=A0ABX0PDG2_9BURK|nr:AEC family transporter [Telluria antibiotica]NIA55401.1 AEC family transporter [Telluria antibiotica]
MLNIFMSVLPIFLLITAGYLVKNRFVRDDGFWKAADKLVYYVFFPSLLLLDVSDANFASANTSSSILATVGGTLLVAIFILVAQRVVTVRNDLFTSIFQGGVRYNSYVFVALAQSLSGAEGVAISGVFVAYMIVLTNVMSVLVMNHYGTGGKKSFKGTVAAMVQNPLIIGAMLGLALNVADLHVAGAARQFLTYLGNAATPLSLMSVGAGLMLVMQARQAIATGYAVGLKLLVMPLCTLTLLKVQGASGTPAHIALLYSSVPCAGNAYIMARQMGGDSETMASIITWTTLLSAVTITVIIGTITQL